MIVRVGCFVVFAVLAVPVRSQAVSIKADGGVRRWHAVTLTLTGPRSAESAKPNPFLDYRFRVVFTHRQTRLRYVVPGYFAADGDAANTSASAGAAWRAHLCPDRTGTWDYVVSFRGGTGIAIDRSVAAGSPVAPYDGVKGSFQVQESDKSGRDFRGKGRLRYVGRHHLQFASGEWFLKAGADSPENLLAYADIDNTPNTGNRRKTWSAHLRDWRSGDPTWASGKGKGLIGALNYLAGKGMNAFSFLTYSFNGDDKNVFPYVNPADRLRMDCSKLDQWGCVFAHATRAGLYLHFKTQETENDQDLDGGALGVQRKLYYRELIARYGHNLALNWNLGEENTNTTAQQKAFAQWFADLDPYDHPVVLHTYPNQKSKVYGPLLGSASTLAGASLQSQSSAVFVDTLKWRRESAKAGRKWVVANDEQGPANDGIKPDANDPTHRTTRRDVIWGHFMAGGAGIESYFGYRWAHSDLTCQDWRSRDKWWDQCRFALEFFGRHRVPFQAMANADSLVDRGHCLAGHKYFAIYLATGGSAQLDLAGESGAFTVHWYDPRNGGALQSGSVITITAGAKRSLGTPPRLPAADWVILVRPAGKSAGTKNYGRGCVGTGGKRPAMGSVGLPRLGNHAFAVELRGGLPHAIAALLAGATQLSVPLSGGCTLYADGILIAAQTDAAGTARHYVSVPFDTGLLGQSVYLTGAVVDPQGSYYRTLAIADGIALTAGY